MLFPEGRRTDDRCRDEWSLHSRAQRACANEVKRELHIKRHPTMLRLRPRTGNWRCRFNAGLYNWLVWQQRRAMKCWLHTPSARINDTGFMSSWESTVSGFLCNHLRAVMVCAPRFRVVCATDVTCRGKTHLSTGFAFPHAQSDRGPACNLAESFSHRGQDFDHCRFSVAFFQHGFSRHLRMTPVVARPKHQKHILS
jgi:hypothetical protein